MSANAASRCSGVASVSGPKPSGTWSPESGLMVTFALSKVEGEQNGDELASAQAEHASPLAKA
jgi:hypothetical protein